MIKTATIASAVLVALAFPPASAEETTTTISRPESWAERARRQKPIQSFGMSATDANSPVKFNAKSPAMDVVDAADKEREAGRYAAAYQKYLAATRKVMDRVPGDRIAVLQAVARGLGMMRQKYPLAANALENLRNREEAALLDNNRPEDNPLPLLAMNEALGQTTESVALLRKVVVRPTVKPLLRSTLSMQLLDAIYAQGDFALFREVVGSLPDYGVRGFDLIANATGEVDMRSREQAILRALRAIRVAREVNDRDSEERIAKRLLAFDSAYGSRLKTEPIQALIADAQRRCDALPPPVPN